jgi:hypothetical protein
MIGKQLISMVALYKKIIEDIEMGA